MPRAVWPSRILANLTDNHNLAEAGKGEAHLGVRRSMRISSSGCLSSSIRIHRAWNESGKKNLNYPGCSGI